MTQINLRIEDGLLGRIDEARGEVARSQWIRDACELRISGQPTPLTLSRERAIENRRASSDVKRDIAPVQKEDRVRPTPKGGRIKEGKKK